MTKPLLTVHDLHAAIGNTPILCGVNLEVGAGEIHFLMGPNGSGKSTLAHALMGSPAISITRGSIHFSGEEITTARPEERARKGMYLGFQYPVELAGVGVAPFLRSVLASRGEALPSEEEFRKTLLSAAEHLRMPVAVLDRNLNEGFSGGEKKRSEIFQLQVLKPTLAILDEFDSGLDVDGIRSGIESLKRFLSPDRALLLITHYGRTLEHLRPDRVHVMVGGRIVKEGGEELVRSVEDHGFETFQTDSGT